MTELQISYALPATTFSLSLSHGYIISVTHVVHSNLKPHYIVFFYPKMIVSKSCLQFTDTDTVCPLGLIQAL